VRTTNFKPGFLDLSEVRYVSEATFAERIERLRPQPGDVLYSREGGILGIACMIPPNVELCLGQRMMLFKTTSGFSATLLMHWLNSPVILRRVQELTGGSASPHLNVRDIKSFPIPFPPLLEQQEIVRRVQSMFLLADQIEGHLSAAQRQVDALTPSLLARAFAGKLVPQDPGDEPAAKLLERIRKGGPRITRMPRIRKGNVNP
jgi:type I restriction enzyme S subunit